MTECLFNTAVPVYVRSYGMGQFSGFGSAIAPPPAMPFFSTTTPIHFQDAANCTNGRQLNSVVFEIYLVPLVAGKKMLQLRVSDVNDPFFNFQLDLPEEDFFTLRRDQNLLVDFAHFPYKLIELLQRCLQESTLQSPAFSAQLATGSEEGRGFALLSFQETTSFRQMTQLSLKLKTVGEDVLRRQLSELLNRYREQIASLQAQVASQPSNVYSGPSIHVPTSGPGSSANAPVSVHVPGTVKTQSMTSGNVKHTAQMSGMQSLLREKDEACAHMNELLEITRESKHQLEDANSELRKRCEAQETEIIRCTEEINKANEIIRKLQDEIRTLKARVKTASSIADDQAANASQLKASNERQAAELERLSADLMDATTGRKRFEREVTMLQEELNSLRKQNLAKDEIIAHFQKEQNVHDLNRALRQLDQSLTATEGPFTEATGLTFSGLSEANFTANTEASTNPNSNTPGNNENARSGNSGYVGSKIFETPF